MPETDKIRTRLRNFVCYSSFCVEKAHTIHKRIVNIQLNFRGKSAKSPFLFHWQVLQKSKIYSKGDEFNQNNHLKKRSSVETPIRCLL